MVSSKLVTRKRGPDRAVGRRSRSSPWVRASTLFFFCILALVAIAVLASIRKIDPSKEVERLYRSMHRSEFFRACKQKVRHCLKTEQHPEKRICIDHQPTAHHPDRLSRDNAPTTFAWNRSCRPESCGLIFIGAEQAHQSSFWASPGYCKVLFNLEPPGLYPVKDQIDRFIEEADLVLTSSSPADFARPDKVFPFLYGSTWIQRANSKVHNKSRMVSMISSGKTMLDG